MTDDLVEMQDRIDRLEEALEFIRDLDSCYPEDIFPPPDIAKVRLLLHGSGITLDSVAAYCLRHLVKTVSRTARRALEKE